MFRQVHEPGRLGLSDFTAMADAGITIAGVQLAPVRGRSLRGWEGLGSGIVGEHLNEATTNWPGSILE
jgi:hypothetical protein